MDQGSSDDNKGHHFSIESGKRRPESSKLSGIESYIQAKTQALSSDLTDDFQAAKKKKYENESLLLEAQTLEAKAKAVATFITAGFTKEEALQMSGFSK